jgi:glutaredoxin-related protein
MMSKNVMIPLFLLDQIMELLERWDISEYNPSLRYDYDNVVWALAVKKQKLRLRDAYAEMLQVESQQASDAACICYLQQKALLDDAQEDIPF